MESALTLGLREEQPRRGGFQMLNMTEMRKKKFSTSDLSNFGLEDLAYIKVVKVDGHVAHAIHAADGTPLTVVNDRSLAFATVSQHDMQALSVH